MNGTRPNDGTGRRRGAALLAIVALLALVPPARGQGSSVLPGPITSQELSGYAERLGLNDQQRLAIEIYHETYRDSYAALESSEIEPFLADSGTPRFGLRMMLDRDSAEQSLRRMQRITSRIEAMDERLFVEIQAVLTEDQAAGIDRVRDHRARRRLRAGPGRFAAMINPAVTVELGDVVHGLEVDPPLRDDLDARLASYERDLTAALRRLHQRTLRLVDEMFDRVEALALDDPGGAGRVERRRSLGAARVIWSETAEALAVEAARIGSLNRRAVAALRLMLPDAPGFEVHRGYYGRAYGELDNWDRPTRERFESVLERLEETGALHAGVETLYRAWRSDAARLTEEAADAIDAQRLISGSSSRTTMMERQEQQRRITALRDERVTAQAAAIAELEAMLVEEPAAIAGASAPPRADAPDGDAGAAALPDDAAPGPPRGSLALALPGPFSAHDLDDAVEQLDLDETGATIAATMHQDYLAAHRAMESGEPRERLRRLKARRWTVGPDGRVQPPLPGDVDLLYAAYRAALAAIRQNDAILFENLEAVAGPEHAVTVQRIRMSRQRDIDRRVCRAAPAGPARIGPVNVAPIFNAGPLDEILVDVPRLFRDVETGAADPETLASILVAHEQRATEILRRAAEARFALGAAEEKLAAEKMTDARRAAAEGRRATPYGASFHELRRGPQQRFRAIKAEMVAENRAVLDRLEAALPEASFRRLEGLYARQAFPEVFSDEHSIGPILAAALELPDLGPSRRLAIEDIAAAYGPEWDEHCRRLVAVELSANVGGAAPGGWRDRADRHRRLQRIERERDDLNHRTLLQLRALLLPEQAARIGLDDLESR